jgi:hypothetical protein
MQWSKRGAHLLLQTRVMTLNRELGAVFQLDDFFYFLEQLGVVDWLGNVQGTAVQSALVPVVQ